MRHYGEVSLINNTVEQYYCEYVQEKTSEP